MINILETLPKNAVGKLDKRSLRDAVLLSTLRVLKPGGIVVGLLGPPDPAFAKEIGANLLLGSATALISARRGCSRVAGACGTRSW